MFIRRYRFNRNRFLNQKLNIVYEYLHGKQKKKCEEEIQNCNYDFCVSSFHYRLDFLRIELTKRETNVKQIIQSDPDLCPLGLCRFFFIYACHFYQQYHQHSILYSYLRIKLYYTHAINAYIFTYYIIIIIICLQNIIYNNWLKFYFYHL